MSRYYPERRIRSLYSRPDTAEAAAERVRRRTVGEQVWRELQAQFPVITAENFEEADRWRQRREADLLDGGEVRP